jgi:hypothetical protein
MHSFAESIANECDFLMKAYIISSQEFFPVNRVDGDSFYSVAKIAFSGTGTVGL